jgi:putative transposase
MRRNRFNVKEIIKVLEEAELGITSIKALCRKHGIAEPTFYNWKNKYGGLSVSEAYRLDELQDENAKLKRLLAERDLEVHALKEVIKRNF